MNDDRRKLLDTFAAMSTGQIIDKGYHKFLIRNHHKANTKGYVRSSLLLAEHVLGKNLPDSAIVHHMDEDTLSLNIAICESQSYHRLLHARLNAYKACGDPRKRKCVYCKQYDDLKNLHASPGGTFYHVSCSANDERERRERKRNEQHAIGEA